MPTRFRDLNSNNFGSLNASKNKNLVRYNATSGKFETITIDDLLGLAENIPETFTDFVEQNIDVNNLQLEGVDGGTF
jgi:hypothetical protein